MSQDLVFARFDRFLGPDSHHFATVVLDGPSRFTLFLFADGRPLPRLSPGGLVPPSIFSW